MDQCQDSLIIGDVLFVNEDVQGVAQDMHMTSIPPACMRRKASTGALILSPAAEKAAQMAGLSCVCNTILCNARAAALLRCA